MLSPDLTAIVADAKRLAKQYRQLTGRPLGVTGEIAELEAARLLGLTLAPARQAGWDAIDPASGRRYQIKGRVFGAHASSGQRLGSLSADDEWDAVLLVLLNDEYEVQAIWEAERVVTLELLARPGSRARSERGQLGVRQLIKVGTLRWGSPVDSAPTRPRNSGKVEIRPDGAVRYRFSRLCFRADVIEPLHEDDTFEVETPVGLFRMTKRQFSESFARLRETKSYAERGIYHFPTVPQRAEKFRVGTVTVPTGAP
jgi:hypothetical protein